LLLTNNKKEKMSDLFEEIILWKPLKVVSLIIYILVILLIPISQFWSVIILFALIALWSRVPCLVSMFTKDLDVVDFFTVMLAIHVGGLFGGIFGFIVMMFSRLFGPNEWFLYTLKDAISIMVSGFLAPLFYNLFGSALLTLYAFTITRWVLYLGLTALIEPEYMGLELGLCSIGTLKSYLYNTFVMKTFEGALLGVFAGGVHFSIGLFMVATGVIAGFYVVGKVAKLLEKVFPRTEDKLFVNN